MTRAFGRQFRVERVDRRKSGQFVHIEVLPGIFMVGAAWMLDPAACTGINLGTPRVSLAALSDLDDLLSRRGLRRSSSGDVIAGKEQTDARPPPRAVEPQATADAVRLGAVARDEPTGAPAGIDAPGHSAGRSGRNEQVGARR